MAWETVSTFVDPENGNKIEKQRRRRNGRGNETRYLVQVNRERFVYLSRTQLFDLADTSGDVCDMIEKGEF
jgi:hypothetical protein